MKTIGERVRDLRKAKGYSRQGDLAKLVGVDQSVISDIENGAGFKADVLMALCEHLGVSAEHLMHGQETAASGETEILSLYRKMSDEGRSALMAAARGLKSSFPRTEKTTPPMNMVAAPRTREFPVVEMLHEDTIITNNEKHIELSIPDTGKKKGGAGDQSSSNPRPESPERGKHVAGASKTRRSR